MIHCKNNDLCHTKLPHVCAVRPLSWRPFCGASPPLPPTAYPHPPPMMLTISLRGVTNSPYGVTNPPLWCYKYKFSLMVLQMPPPLPPPPFVVLQIPPVVLQIPVWSCKSSRGVTDPRVVLQISLVVLQMPPPPPRGVANPPRGVTNYLVLLQILLWCYNPPPHTHTHRSVTIPPRPHPHPVLL